MSSSSRHGRSGTGSSPTRSTATYSQVTAAGQQKLNVVTRVAIEGKSKSGKGAAIKMYLKISLPLESVSPGATIALFPEENLKILDSQVHPLDANSVPYNFSSTTSPLLHRAARALNLPARSPQSYMSMSTASVTSTTSSASVPPVDDRYTGHVLRKRWSQ
ncbi:hypothetical protein A0H81_10722 [Grifola frondosa]|uniref:Uncharacterized protein n=1 Tax=Grifola frondosa TaxID=5627 RepID=A0A1C7LYM6_GRIFR|nr:hypothetical protein A0H81_10722 [Grifola frondosa]